MQGPSLPFLGSVPIVPHTFSILFRLSGPRTWVFPSFSFILGYAVGGGGELSQIGIGIAVASLVTAATNIINAYADRKEDATNQPQRLFWLGQIGSRQITASLLLLYSISTALALYLGPLFTVVLGLGIFNSIFYSLPPLRFKATPFIVLVTLVALGFLGPIYIADLALVPLLIFIFIEMLKARDSAGLEKAHTLGFFYAISFLLFTLVLTSPTVQSLVMVLVAYFWALTVAKVSVHSRVEYRDWEKQRRKKP